MDDRKASGWAEGVGLPERPLGRGLEDVSHLFLSHAEPAAMGGRSGMGPPPTERETRPRSGGLTSLQRVEAITRSQLGAILRDRNLGLEEGLSVVDESVPCPPCGEIDLLATDRTGQLAVVDVDTASNDDLLLRGLSHVDWLVRNLSNVRRMYTGRTINFSAIPRLLLLAPDFSERLTRVVQSLGHTSVECVRYHVVHMPGGLGVLFERVKSV